MTPPKRWTPGDPLTAQRLNQTVFESAIPRREVVLGNGSSLVNESLGNQTANMRTSRIKLVAAVEDFQIQTESTDLNDVIDDVPSGLVREVRLNRKTGLHSKETMSGDFRAWDVMSGLTGALCDSVSTSSSDSQEEVANEIVTCDVFYVIFNEDSKRWEVLSFAGSSLNVIHGIIKRIIGKGYYEVYISTWNGITPACDFTSGSDSGDKCDICDILGLESDSGSDDCEIDLELPEPDNQTEQTDVIVLAYDSGSIFVPLRVGTDCLMMYLGDRNLENSTSTSGSASGSGSDVSSTERVYQIIRGHQEHLILYRERWECCNGLDTLVGRTPIIFPGIECPEQICVVCEEA
jgi:hypothetical protein